MTTIEQKNYLTAEEVLTHGIEYLEEATYFSNLVSKEMEDVCFDSGGITFDGGKLSVLISKNESDNSAFALNILNDVAVKQGISAAYFSIESIDEKDISNHLLSINTKVSLWKIRNGQLSLIDMKKIHDAAGGISNGSFYVSCNEKLSVRNFVRLCKKIYTETKFKLLIADTRNLSENKKEEIWNFLCEIEQFSRMLNIPVLLLVEEKSFKRIKKSLYGKARQTIFLARKGRTGGNDSPIFESEIKIVSEKGKEVRKIVFDASTKVFDFGGVEKGENPDKIREDI